MGKIITGFNTPKLLSNLAFGNPEMVKNIGFNVVWRWQDEVFWESTLATGKVPSFSTIDAQVNFRFPKLKSTIKLGGTNIFDHRYIQFVAGPTIGGLYYAAITWMGC